MAAVVSIDQGIELAATKMGAASAANQLRGSFGVFNTLWPAHLDEQIVAQRTVRNWYTAALEVQQVTPTQGNAVQVQAVVDIVVRVLYAAQAAQAAGRISAAQSNAILADYNAAFALF